MMEILTHIFSYFYLERVRLDFPLSLSNMRDKDVRRGRGIATCVIYFYRISWSSLIYHYTFCHIDLASEYSRLLVFEFTGDHIRVLRRQIAFSTERSASTIRVIANKLDSKHKEVVRCI